jgi:hypothetical protein
LTLGVRLAGNETVWGTTGTIGTGIFSCTTSSSLDESLEIKKQRKVFDAIIDVQISYLKWFVFINGSIFETKLTCSFSCTSPSKFLRIPIFS